MKRIVAAIAVLVGLSCGALAQQAYPNRIIHLMQGFPPGGNVDIIARILGHEMEKSLGQSIVVEAKPGLAGALAAEAVARSRCRRLHAVDVAERASGLCGAVEERQIQGGRRLHLDFGRELLSVHDRREGGLALPEAEADDRRGAHQARRIEIRLGRRRLDPAHHRRTDRQSDQDQVLARSLSRRGAGAHGPAARRDRFHRRDHRAGQPAGEVGRVPRARGDRQDALARFPRRADRRQVGHSRLRGDILDRPCGPAEPAEADRRPAQRRTAQGAGGAGREEQARGDGRRSARHHARRDEGAGARASTTPGRSSPPRRTCRSIRARSTYRPRRPCD